MDALLRLVADLLAIMPGATDVIALLTHPMAIVALLALALLVTAAIVAAWIKLGGTRTAHFEQTIEGPFVLYYKEHTGPFPSSGQLYQQLDSLRKQCGAKRLGGLYFDNPCLMPADKCRARIGVVCTLYESAEWDGVLLDAGLKKHELPYCKYLTASWIYPTRFASIAVPIAMRTIYRTAKERRAALKDTFGVLELYEPSKDLPAGEALAKVCYAAEKDFAFTHPADVAAQ